MATTTIDLSKLAVTTAGTFDDATQVVTIGGTGVVGTRSTDGKTLTLAGYGTLKFTGTTEAVKFTADSALAGGTYGFSNLEAKAVVGEADFSAATNGVAVTADAILVTVTGGSGNDTLTASADGDAINAGAGDDKVTLSAANAVAAATLGAGADTVTVADAAVSVADYNYAQGDKVVLSAAFKDATTALNASGVFLSDTSKASVSSAKADGVFKVAVTDNAKESREYWTAGTAAGAVTLDASARTDKTVINAAAASSAVISSGYGNDTITAAAGQTTLSAGKASGTDTITSLKATDTLVLTGNGTVSDLTFADGSIKYANTSLVTALVTGTQGTINVSFDNGTTVKKLAYGSAGTALTQASDVDVYYATTAATTLSASSDVNMLDTSKYVGTITGINVTGSGAFIGSKSASTSIDASNATGAVQIWGGSTKADAISLKASNATADTVWFGTADGAGVDTVTGFDNGFKSTSDVLKLYDTTALSSVSFKKTGTDRLMDIVTGTSTIKAALTNDDQIEIMLSDGTVKKVATETGTAAIDDINGVGADVVIGTKSTAADNVVTYGSKQTDAVTVNLHSTDVYQNISNVCTKDATGGAIVVGSASNSSGITLGAGTNQVWGGSSDADTIVLTTNVGTDTVWFGSSDGADAVTGTKAFNAATDTIKFWDASSVKDVFKKYSLTGLADNSMTFTSQDNTDSTLTVANDITAAKAGGTSINVTDANNTAIKALVGTATTLNFATDVQIYDAMSAATTVSVQSSTSGTVTAFLDNGGWADAGSYYFSDNVTGFDASASTASTVLIGRAKTASTLRGGLTNNNIWGGGYASQDIQGNISAVDTVWFGSSDGADKFSAGADKNDTIYLWDVNDISNVSLSVDSTTQETLVIGGSTLKITDTGTNDALNGGLTFKLANNTSYTYDTTNKKFVAKA